MVAPEKKRKLHSRLGVDESQPRAEYVLTKMPYIVLTKKLGFETQYLPQGWKTEEIKVVFEEI